MPCWFVSWRICRRSSKKKNSWVYLRFKDCGWFFRQIPPTVLEIPNLETHQHEVTRVFISEAWSDSKFALKTWHDFRLVRPIHVQCRRNLTSRSWSKIDVDIYFATVTIFEMSPNGRFWNISLKQTPKLGITKLLPSNSSFVDVHLTGLL